MAADAGKTRADLILDTVTDLVDRLLDWDGDDELPPGAIEAAVASREISVEHMAARFTQELGARLSGNDPHGR